MEPSLFGNALTWLLVYVAPFMCFAIGVFISIELGLNGDLSGKHTMLMAIPVGVLTVGNLLMTMSFMDVDPHTNSQVIKFGHIQSVGQFLVFSGTVILYGTLVPQLFNQVRVKLSAHSHGSGMPEAERER
jgi:hypothetical protein